MKRGVFVISVGLLSFWHVTAQAQNAAPATVPSFPAEAPPEAPAAAPVEHRAASLAPESAPRPGPKGPSALSQYRQQEFSTRFRFWEGQQLLRGGEPADLGYFGGNGDSLFALSPTALEDIHRFRTMRITGTALYVVGLGLLVTELVLVAQRSPLVVEENADGKAAEPKPLFWALFLPGTAAGLTGGVLMQSANSYLSDAVEHYNADLAQRLERQSAVPATRGVFLRYQGNF